MSVPLIPLLIAIACLGTGVVLGILLGIWIQTHRLIRKMLEAKDEQIWLAGRYLSIDIREQTGPHRRRRSGEV